MKKQLARWSVVMALSLAAFLFLKMPDSALASGGINNIQTVSASASEADSITANLSQVTAGDLLVVGIHLAGPTGSFGSVTDNLSDTFTKAIDINTNSGGEYGAVYYLSNAPAGISSVTANFPLASHADIVVSEYSGIAAASPLDVSSVFDNGWNSPKPFTSGFTTETSASNELLWGFFYESYNTQTWTPGAGWTGRNNQSEVFAEDQVVGSTGTYAATSNIQSTSGYWVGGTIVTFKASQGGSSSVAPTISSFTASPTSITAGQTATLSWSVAGSPAPTVSISGIGTVTGNSVAVSPLQTTTYILTATNSAGSATAQATVTVMPAQQGPVINSFTVSPSTIALGQSATLSWSIASTTNLSANINGVGPIPQSGSVAVTPSSTKTYVLVASNNAGTASQNATLTVNTSSSAPASPSVPQGLTANALSSSQIALSWSPSTGGSGVAGYDVYRKRLQIATTTNTTYTDSNLLPGTTYTYTVSAYDTTGNMSAQSNAVAATTQGGSSAPVFNSFAASPSSITDGQLATLSWSVSGNPAPTVSISGIGTVTGSSVTVSPSQTTTYTLTATNSAGLATTEVTVDVTAGTPPSVGGPTILFTDVSSGPTTGGPSNLGIPISIFGEGFGASQGSSTVTIGGVPVASYLVWGQNNANNNSLDMIVVQPGPNVTGGAIVVTVGGQSSNANNTFTARSGNIYYISTTGSDSNNCSVSSPCKTISNVAENVMKPGDTVLVEGGTYSGDDIWIRGDDGENGAPGEPKVIKNYPGQQVSEVKLSDNFLVDANYITVSGIDFPDGATLVDPGWYSYNETGDSFYNNSFTGEGSYAGIEIQGVNNIAAGNYCDQSGSTVGTEGQCYYIEQSSGVQILYNVAASEGGYGIQAHEEPRQANDINRTISNLLIEGNIVETSPQRSGVVIEIDACNSYGCYKNAINGVNIINNILTANNFNGIEVAGGTGGATVSDVNIYNNTFYQNGLLGLAIDNTSSTNDVNVSNNLFYQSANANCTQNCSWYGKGDIGLGAAATDVSINTNYYGPGAPTFVSMNSPYGPVAVTDSNPVLGTVNFANASSLDFQELAGSVTIGSGLSIPLVPTDINGTPRPQGDYDIGAYQYISNSPLVIPHENNNNNNNTLSGSLETVNTNTSSGNNGNEVGAASVSIPSSSSMSPVTAQSQLNSLMATLQALIAQAKQEGVSLPANLGQPVFSSNLSVGSTGSEVEALQTFLIKQNRGTSAQSLAAVGATAYFGPLTKQALIEFQKSAGITPASGYFGPITRAYINSMGQ